MVEVYKTNIARSEEAVKVTEALLGRLPGSRISFDLEDCDKVLRIAGNEVPNEMVIHMLGGMGYVCEVMGE